MKYKYILCPKCGSGIKVVKLDCVCSMYQACVCGSFLKYNSMNSSSRALVIPLPLDKDKDTK